MQLEFSGCILSKFYIKPQLRRAPCKDLARCILSKFYIKPQRATCTRMASLVVSYRNSTSNHNNDAVSMSGVSLYLIEILHQTTTFDFRPRFSPGCILSKFYIKPQRVVIIDTLLKVVSYRNSTSNHNHQRVPFFSFSVVSYRNSTSNHNMTCCRLRLFRVVSYRNSTSNHNSAILIVLTP